MHSEGYFLYEFDVAVFSISVNFCVLQSLAYGMALGNNLISILNLVINKDGIQIVGQCNSFQVGYIKIMRNSIKNLNYAANFFEKVKILEATNYLHKQKKKWGTQKITS